MAGFCFLTLSGMGNNSFLLSTGLPLAFNTAIALPNRVWGIYWKDSLRKLTLPTLKTTGAL
jgi:hypothetical protein